MERLRAAAAAELTHEEVKPIQSDFHFFAKENAVKFRLLAEEEIRKSLNPDEQLDPMLVNTNLNSRLKMAWENLTNDQRDTYMIKEEEDRRRFMEEDEIASRHCATLTARGKSPRAADKAEKTTKNDERQESDTNPDDESSPDSKGVSPTSEENVQVDSNQQNAKLRTELTSELIESLVNSADHSPQKRPSSPIRNGDPQIESPTKKNRQSLEKQDK